MIPFVILFISATSALGADFRNYNGQYQPRGGSQDSQTYSSMDYFDDIFNQDMKVKPESKFTYNFEQTRRDQPPQVEIREEDVGRYFHSRPTTTTPRSIFSMKVDSKAQHVYPNVNPTNEINRQSWNEPQVSSVPPPPKFGFSRRRNEVPPQYHLAPFKNNPIVVAQHQTTATPTVQWTEHHNVQNPPRESQYLKESEKIRFAPSASYVSDSITDSKRNYHHDIPNRGRHSTPTRGHHKFSWDDIKNANEKPTGIRQDVILPQVSTIIEPNTASPVNELAKTPPSVPTLSPWFDGFGK